MTDPLTDMPEIPRPSVLDSHRELGDDREDLTLEQHRSRSRQLASALADMSRYAEELWQTSARMRTYLHEHTPSDSADDNAWKGWQDAYAATVSVLCGPHGDSGLGSSQAQVIAQNRRAE